MEGNLRARPHAFGANLQTLASQGLAATRRILADSRIPPCRLIPYGPAPNRVILRTGIANGIARGFFGSQSAGLVSAAMRWGSGSPSEKNSSEAELMQ